MNIATYRRYSWISVIIAAALSISLPQTLTAQPAPSDQPAATPAVPGQLKTLAVLAGARYEKLLADISFLGSLAGRPEAGQLADAIVAQYTMGKAATAIDKTKPWGVIVQTDGATFYPVACLPIAKPDDVLEVAKAFGAEIKDGENGTKELVLPNQRSLFMKSQNDMVFISIASASLARLPAHPQEILTKMVADYDLSAAISVKNIPETYRQFAISAMQAGLQQAMNKLPDETDEHFAERQRLAEGQISQMTRLMNEIDSIKLGWAVDSQQQRTYLDFTYQFVPGSKMAQQIAAYGEQHTNFAGFYQPDAAATLTVTTKTDPKLIAEDLAQFENMMRSMREQLNSEIDKSDKLGDVPARDALKAASADFFDALMTTVKEGQMDGGASLYLSPQSLTIVAGMHVKEPAKIESGLKKLEAAKSSPDFPIKAIQWNVATHAGVNFHSISMDTSKCEFLRKFSTTEPNITVGIGPDAAYLAIGQNEKDALSKAIDASTAAKGKAVSPFEFTLSLRPILEVAADQAENPREKEAIQAVADMLKNQAQGRDHIRAVGQVIPNGLRYRFEAEEGVLRAIGAAAIQGQRQRLRANQ